MIYGKTNKQRLREVKRIEDWHVWFAWKPITLNGGRICWLQRVMRKGEWCCSYDGGSWEYDYKEVT